MSIASPEFRGMNMANVLVAATAVIALANATSPEKPTKENEITSDASVSRDGIDQYDAVGPIAVANVQEGGITFIKLNEDPFTSAVKDGPELPAPVVVVTPNPVAAPEVTSSAAAPAPVIAPTPVTSKTTTTAPSPANVVNPANVYVPPLPEILQEIGGCESAGSPTAAINYTIPNSEGSSASGGFQFEEGTWNYFYGYSQAMYAPANIQNLKAEETYAEEGTGPWISSEHCWDPQS
jgi:hypothetical protein